MCGVHDRLSRGKPMPPTIRSRLELTRFKDIGNHRHRWVMLPNSSDRAALRKQGRLARRSLSPSARRAGTDQLNKRLCYQLHSAKRVALYLAFDGEPDVLATIAALIQQGKQVYLPQLTKRGMRFVSLQALIRGHTNQYGILEPHKSATTIASKRLQAIVMPLTAYDAYGERLGMGAGYYDRTLAWRHNRRQWLGPKLVGAAWRTQQAEKIPTEDWDIRLDALCNEKQTLRFSRTVRNNR